MFLLEFQLDKWPENSCCKNFENIWLSRGNLLTSCVRSKSFQLSTKDGIPTQLLLIYSSQDRFHVTIAAWVHVVWKNRNYWKFSVNKKSRPSTYHIQTNASQCAECAFNRKQEFLGILPTLISSHHKPLEVHLLSSITENSCNNLFISFVRVEKKYMFLT